MDLPIMPFMVSIPAFVLIGFTIFDIVRRSDLTAVRKALWIVAVIALPVFGTFLYLLARPFRDPAHQTLRGNDRTHAIVALLQRHAAGSIDEAEFASAKRRVFDEAMAAHRARNA